jgi:hypothetical protein
MKNLAAFYDRIIAMIAAKLPESIMLLFVRFAPDKWVIANRNRQP